ncbi:MAG TPA: hypothetical protein VM012_01165 [Flavitalea sp.]|nr:hypothetical protein [Flavitalea sp.]
MKKFIRYIYSFSMLLITLLSLVTDWYGPLTLILTVLVLVMTVDKMGKGIVLRESAAMLYVFTCLFMPLIGYIYYSFNNPLARLWVKYMPVPEDVYFGFALPAIAAFCFALCIPLGITESEDEDKGMQKYIVRIKEIIAKKPTVGIYIIAIGLATSVFTNLLPGGLQFFATLFFFAGFAGLLYLWYAPSFPYKNWAIGGFLLFIVANALSTGMFTIVAYMGITIFSFFLLGRKTSLLKKLILSLIAIAFLLVLQNTKGQYRRYTWISTYEGNTALLFGKLFWENLQRGEELLSVKAVFPVYVRTNQGFNVALVMRRIPNYQAHDNGENLFIAFASSLVPRFLWSDKPEAGGKFNMKYYTGINLVGGWSTNIGPLGEAYGAFGVAGGILYMFLLGVFIRWSYKKVFDLGYKLPLLICWIPVLFYQVIYSGETDTLQIMNALFKTTFFMILIYRFIPSWFGIYRQKRYRKTKAPVAVVHAQ